MPKPEFARTNSAFPRAESRTYLLKEIVVPAYWLARCKINNPVEYKKYTDRVPAIVQKYGGKVLARVP